MSTQDDQMEVGGLLSVSSSAVQTNDIYFPNLRGLTNRQLDLLFLGLAGDITEKLAVVTGLGVNAPQFHWRNIPHRELNPLVDRGFFRIIMPRVK